MNNGFLTNKEFEHLYSLLLSAKLMDENELMSLQKRHPYAVIIEGSALKVSNKKYYSLDNKNLNNFILEKFGKPEYNIDFFYELVYEVGDSTTAHLDKKISAQTTLVLLSETFLGGELLIDKKNMNFNKIGQFVNFEGYRQLHEVTKIESGKRNVLVIMFNKKQIVL